MKIQNLVGEEFGRYKVIEYAGPKWPDKKSKGHQWCCECECGVKKIVLGSSLKSGNTKSCGCHHHDVMSDRHTSLQANQLMGRRFGKLFVECDVGRKYGQILWRCKCDCGNTKDVVAASLKRGATKSCGQGDCAKRYIHGLSGKPGYKKYLLADPTRRLRHYVGSFVAGTLKNRHSNKGGKSVWVVLTYSPDDLRRHLEGMFEPWMTWDNYGSHWHIDHITPQAKFQFISTSDPSFVECWALSNLRPLEKIANLKKGST